MKNQWIFVVLLLSQGCASTESYRDIVSSWDGVELERLITSWGRPNKIYHLTNGNTVVKYYDTSKFGVSDFPQSSSSNPRASANSNNRLSNAGNNDSENRRSSVSIPNTQKKPSARTIKKTCKTTFTADANNVIIRWKYEGDKCNVR